MNGEHAAAALFLVLALTLPLSALIARGLPPGRLLRLALVWGAIFLAVAIVAGLLPRQIKVLALHNIYYQTERAA